MSRENVAAFFAASTKGAESGEPLPGEPTADDVIRHAGALGFSFSEAELRSHMKELIYGAHSLPKGWGWPLARNLGLTHRT
jgi:hypothetical protein